MSGSDTERSTVARAVEAWRENGKLFWVRREDIVCRGSKNGRPLILRLDGEPFCLRTRAKGSEGEIAVRAWDDPQWLPDGAARFRRAVLAPDA